MKKQDFLAGLIIGEACALIFLGIAKTLDLPLTIFKFAKFFPIALPVLSILGLYIVESLFKKTKALIQFARSFLVGILNTFIDLGVLNILIALSGITSGWKYSGLVTFSFACSTINSYLWNKFWAFEKKETKVGTKEFSQFALVAGGGLLIHLIVSSFLVNIIGPQFGLSKAIWANIGKIAAVLIGFIWTFTGYKFLVFKK